MTPDQKEPAEANPNRLTIHYVKSPQFRSVYADGIYGGVTPSAKVHMVFFSERNPIPQQIDIELKPDGMMGKEIPNTRLGKAGLIRDVDVGVLMELDTAIAFRQWLDRPPVVVPG